MSSQEYIRSIKEYTPDDSPLFPFPKSLSSLSSAPASTSAASSPATGEGGILGLSFETWIIIILILALLGINIFSYLAKGTEETASIVETVFGPILKFFGYTTLSTTKQTIETTASGTKTGVDIVADTSIGAIDAVEETVKTNQSQTQSQSQSQSQSQNQNQVEGKQATTSLPVQYKIQEAGGKVDQWQKESLSKALNDAKQSYDTPHPDDSRSSIQTIGKSGWCYIGEEQGTRTCSEIGINDSCMSGDVFPTQAICMNPNLRA
jgi:hypothetical protein